MMIKKITRTVEMAPWLRALTALAEELSSVPSTHMAAYNDLQCPLLTSVGTACIGVHRHTQAQ